jgi:uncharacterized protein (UPF0335 family)
MPNRIVTITAQEVVTYVQKFEVTEEEYAELKASVNDTEKSLQQEGWIDKHDVDQGFNFEITDVHVDAVSLFE